MKLRFSRKLLYFGGIVAVAELTKIAPEERPLQLDMMLAESVLSRIARIGSTNSATSEVMDLYNRFLAVLEDEDIRDKLNKVTREDRDQSVEFNEMRQKGKLLSIALEDWLCKQYPNEVNGDPHPIHNSLIF